MKIETLKRSHLKRNIMIGVIIVLTISAIVLNFTRAKYRTTQSIPLVNGTINYTLPDLNIIGLYIDGKEATELDSSKTYTLDISKSTCTNKDGSTIPNLTLSYDSENKAFSISPYTTKGTKCTLYFNEQKFIKDTLLTNYPTQLTRNDFNQVVTNTTTGTIYYTDTSKGRTYYFAGNPIDNWVRFGGFYWRIIRINEDGTIRMIYQGTSANTTGTGTQIGISAFNLTFRDNMYVGYMYANGNVHGLESSSTIKEILDTWYQNNLADEADKIDGNAGFCNDRTPTRGTGLGTNTTYYAAYNRLINNKTPSFECSNSSDLYTTSESSEGNKVLTHPIGLITADEVAYAGGVFGASNSMGTEFYLYTEQHFWTMSPYNYPNATIFYVYSTGNVINYSVNNEFGVRPVINLRADITISSGDGTATNPYVVS